VPKQPQVLRLRLAKSGSNSGWDDGVVFDRSFGNAGRGSQRLDSRRILLIQPLRIAFAASQSVLPKEIEMLCLLDTANVKEIAKSFEFYPIAGVTTNPTLIAREERPFYDILTDIREVIGEGTMLHAQVLGPDAETMVAEANQLRDRFGSGIFAKIPVTHQGLKAIRILAAAGFSVTATAILTPLQALLAARAGAAFVAPYVNRIDNSGGDGVGVVADIVRMFSIHGLSTRVLTASFKNVRQVHDMALAGAHAATMAPELLDLIFSHPLTDSGVADFNADWAAAYGADATTLDQ
jgi:fructose-6-phosphate aldolase 2